MREARGKRSLKIGTLLPNIVLYNDPIPHPSSMTTTALISSDLSRRPDLLLIFGTSLKVHGIKKLVKDFAKQVHANKGQVILINNVELGKAEWKGVIDYWVEADCDEWVYDLKTRTPNLWMKQEELPIMPITKSTSRSISCDYGADGVEKSYVTTEEDKENRLPVTPTKNQAVLYACQTKGVSSSPLSPSKRGINVNSLDSPTKRFKRLQINSESPPPKMNSFVG